MPRKAKSKVISIRLDPAMREQFDIFQAEELRESGAIITDSVLARTLLRRALNNDMARSAVSESLGLMHRLNALMVQRLRELISEEMPTLLAEAIQEIEDRQK